MKKISLTIFIAILMLVGAGLVCADGNLTFSWTANDPAPEGYRLFQRASGQPYDYTAPVWSGTGTTCTISAIPDGTYAWVLRAFIGDLESPDSNEVVFTVSEQPPPVVYPCRPKQLIINFD
jgi:hypothetical protein